MVAFIYYDLAFLAVFILFISIFLIKNKKNVKRQGIMFLYHSQTGIKSMEKIVKKYKKALHAIRYFSITLGYILMAGILSLIGFLIYNYVINPSQLAPEVAKIPPIFPLIPYFPKLLGLESYFPPFYFTYFIVAILIVAVVHEFAHGIYMKLYNVKIKSTGFALLGPFVGAFVEQDEKSMERANKINQMTVLSAGVFANIIIAFVFLLLLLGVSSFAFTLGGATFDDYIYSFVHVSDITVVDGVQINNPTNQGLLDIIKENNLATDLTIDTNGDSISLTKISAKNKEYFIRISDFKIQLEQETEFVQLYNDLPAINAGLKGVITEVNGNKIIDHESLTNEMSKYKPGDKIKIKTLVDDEVQEYDIELANIEGRGIIGIGNYPLRENIIAKIYTVFRKPYTFYKERCEFSIFIYYLVFWIFLINLLVALFNMLPASIFDGGRFFYLTILGITKKEKIAKNAYRAMGYLFLFILLLIMSAWFFRIF